MPTNNQSKSQAIEAAQERIRSNRADLCDITSLANELLDRKSEALARAITLIESNNPSDRPQAHKLLSKLRDHGHPNSLRLGITGIPGVGKSTFIERFGLDLIDEGHRVAVLAVDPSSKRTGGSILGDKTRMEKLAVSDNAFIRPSPAADTLGGVARATMEAILLCEAAGYNIILVETVGVGQSETSVRDMVDVFCLLLIGGAGDEVQGIKRGIVEMADIVVVHKADGENVGECRDTASAYRNALHLFPETEGGNKVEVITASSMSGDGHDEFRSCVGRLLDIWSGNGFFESQRSLQRSERMASHAKDLLFENKINGIRSQEVWDRLSQSVESGEMSAFSAAWEWMNS
ncbi:MAG: methylmalonyl Co-A mutase-associated GTPase MeaB [Crocinitomicaceae bacterium]|nr:methylmalonyl Co-A mutase-associated GTPase MeaB [Crocinitomicaceae bacterium]